MAVSCGETRMNEMEMNVERGSRVLQLGGPDTLR
jgi:hypothetical protein